MAASNGGDSILAQNQRLFDVFKEKFSDRPFFAAAAKKFGQWLSNEKAYYAEARKEIVEILSVAEETFHQAEEKLRETTEAHQDQLGELGEAQLALRQAAESQHRQMSAQYTRLILCVAPFQERFVEPDLQASIAKLLASVRNPSAVTVPQIPPPDAVHTPTAIDRSQQMRPSSSSLAAALTPPVPRATQSTVTPTNDPPMSGKDNPNNANAPSVPDAQPQPVRSQPLDAASGSASAPVASSSKPKRRKKKKEDLSKFIQADVQHYKQKMATVPKPVEVPHATAPVGILGGSDPSSSVLPVSSESASTSPLQIHATADNSVSAASVVLSESINHETPIGVESTSKVRGADSNDVVMSVQYSEDVEMIELHPQGASPTFAPASVSSASDTHPTASVSDTAPYALTSATDDEVNRVLRTLTDSGPSIEMAVPIPNNIPDGADPVAVHSDEAMPMVSTDIELPPVPTETYTSQPIPAEVPSSDVTSMEGIVDTPHTNTSDADVTQGAEVAEPPLGNPAAFQAIIQTMVDNVNKLIASDTAVGPQSFSSEGLPTPSATDERWPHPESLPLKTSSDLLRNALANDPKKFYTEEVTPTRTNIKTATVIARHRGLASGTISIDFSINQNQLNSISRWSARSKHSDEIEKSLCITLLCFLAADVRARLESSESRDLRTILPDLECSWPKTGGLSMNALWNGQRMDFPMSPPFALPSNGLVDVSQFLVLGQNTLRFTQTRDMSKYWLILCAHHPTPSQLNAVARRRHKERDWTGWLDKISQPLQLPFKIPVEV